MEKNKVDQFVEEAVKEEVRKGNLIKSKDVLTMLPDMIGTVHIDKKKLHGAIEECMSSDNPFNSILKLFGFQMVQKKKAIDQLLGPNMDKSDVDVKIDDSYAKRWITIDPKKFREVLQKIADKLYELESQANQSYNDAKKRGDDLFDKYEKLTKEHTELKYTSEANEEAVAKRVQGILAANGKEAASENEQLIELLKDLQIDVYWDSSDAPLTDAAMFTEYKVDDESMVSTKPCLVRNDSVFVKGTRFVKN